MSTPENPTSPPPHAAGSPLDGSAAPAQPAAGQPDFTAPAAQPLYPVPTYPTAPEPAYPAPAYPAPAAPPATGAPVYPPAAGAPVYPPTGQPSPGFATQTPPNAAMAAPPAYTAPWAVQTAPQLGAVLNAAPAAPSKKLGRVALILALIAAIVAPIVVAIGVGPLVVPFFNRVEAGGDPFGDLGWLRPVSGWELLAELAVYAGAICGVAAIVAGLIAAIQRRGRAAGIWAIVLSVLAPLTLAVAIFFSGLIALSTMPQFAA